MDEHAKAHLDILEKRWIPLANTLKSGACLSLARVRIFSARTPDAGVALLPFASLLNSVGHPLVEEHFNHQRYNDNILPDRMEGHPGTTPYNSPAAEACLQEQRGVPSAVRLRLLLMSWLPDNEHCTQIVSLFLPNRVIALCPILLRPHNAQSIHLRSGSHPLISCLVHCSST